MKAIVAQSDLVSAYGWGMEPLWQGLMDGRTAIAPDDRFAPRRFVSNQMALIPDLQIQPGQSRVWAMLERLLHPLAGSLDPQTVLILSTTVGQIEFVEQAILAQKPELAQQSRPEILLDALAKMVGVQAGFVYSSACASSSAALARAAGMIRSDEAKSVLLVACDAISEFVYSGFSSLLSLSDQPARPFDAQCAGLTLGEAAAWALVQAVPDAAPVPPGACVILGWGSTTDAVHMTAPDRTGSGLVRAISKACAMIDRRPDEMAFIAAHGTATLYNDAMELVAFSKSVGNPIPMFSIKGGIGHTLGAAGLVQALVAQCALQHRAVPPTVGLRQPELSAAPWVRNTAVDIGSAELALSTNSGFGGVNTAIVLGVSGANA